MQVLPDGHDLHPDAGEVGDCGGEPVVDVCELVAASLIHAAGGHPGPGWSVFCFVMFGLGFVYT